MKRFIAIIALLLVIFTLSACKDDSSTRSTEYDGKQSVSALLDYAKRLEENGDKEAAAAIYDLISKAAVHNANAEGSEPAVSLVEKYNEAKDILAEFGHDKEEEK